MHRTAIAIAGVFRQHALDLVHNGLRPTGGTLHQLPLRGSAHSENVCSLNPVFTGLQMQIATSRCESEV